MSEDLSPVAPEPTVPMDVVATPVAPASPAAPAIPAGWLADPTNAGLQRYWDGAAWTDHTAPAQTAPAAAPMPQIVIQNSASVGGYGRRTNHLLHFILTVLTAGLWLPVWIVVALMNRGKSGNGGGNQFR